LKEGRAASDKSHQCSVAVFGHYPEQSNPFVEGFWHGAQNISARIQNVKRCTTAALKKILSTFD
jgi:hypothetical protein